LIGKSDEMFQKLILTHAVVFCKLIPIF
jgi:hypothetical protein